MSSFTLRNWHNNAGLLFLPAAVVLLILFFTPVFSLLGLSIFNKAGGLTTEHYDRLFAGGTYSRVLLNTVSTAGWTTLLSLVLGYPIAYTLARAGNNVRNLMILAVVVPFWTSFLVRTLAWLVLLGRRGLINRVLVDAGLAEEPLELLYNFNAVLVGLLHAKLPLAVLTMYATMRGINENLPRAASTLGARGVHSFWRIYFPLSFPGVAAASLLVFVSSLGFFITPQLMGGRSEMMIAQLIILEVEEMLNWSFAAAVAVLLLLVTGLLFWVFDQLIGMQALTGQRHGGGQPIGKKAMALRKLGMYLVEVLSSALAMVAAALERIFGSAVVPKLGGSGRMLVVVALLAFLFVPTLFLIPISFTESNFLEWPPRGFSLRWYQSVLNSGLWQSATLRSLYIGLASATLAVLLGVPAAIYLVKTESRLKPLYMLCLTMPLVIPNIIVALALFYAYAKIGLVGTSLGVILGHVVITLPYAVISTMAVFKSYDTRLDQAAWTLGAGRFTTFRLVTAPMILPGIVTAFLFAFVKSFDELTIALFITGGTYATLPKQIWAESLYLVTPALAAVSSLLLVAVSAALLLSKWLGKAKG
ncbi:ABC transporter permease subunit [Bosea sp. PAMC 26642]|uniref:ABC transporter permease subunit n=1 Tax=Bosea sp. (strain PAMC 26642) TaxID=1792307 RepID=UPI000770508B|nr:ABC transporter permease subunit [Bosea sp. PAMC 26642]AMJ61958.1 ABC transporter permease [Bosea sp. PAMC 26642]